MKPVRLSCLACGQMNRVPADRLHDHPRCGVCGEDLLPGKPREVEPGTLERAIRNDDLPLVIDFWAPWCGPCRMMAPEFARAAAMLGNSARFVKLDTQAFPQSAARFGIRGIPTLVIAKSGREIARRSGAMPASAIADWVAGRTGTRDRVA